MSKALIKFYGTAEFDPMSPSSNFYDLYDVAVVDPDSNYEIAKEEHYLNEDEYRSAIRDTYGRKVIDEQERMGFCEVIDDWGELYECECTYHVAYAIDSE